MLVDGKLLSNIKVRVFILEWLFYKFFDDGKLR